MIAWWQGVKRWQRDRFVMYRRKQRLLRKIAAAARVIEDDDMLERVHNAMREIGGGVASKEVLDTLRDMCRHIGCRPDLKRKLNRAKKKLRRMRDWGRMTTVSTTPLRRLCEFVCECFHQSRVHTRNFRILRLKTAGQSTQTAEV